MPVTYDVDNQIHFNGLHGRTSQLLFAPATPME